MKRDERRLIKEMVIKKDSNQLWTFIGIAVVVAIIASVITTSVTGNVIKQNNNPLGKNKVYTVYEVDDKLNTLSGKIETIETGLERGAFNKQVLDTLSKCESFETGDEGIQPGQSCNTICKSQNKICVSTFLYRVKSIDKGFLGGSCDTIWTTKSPIKDAFLDCTCCSASTETTIPTSGGSGGGTYCKSNDDCDKGSVCNLKTGKCEH